MSLEELNLRKVCRTCKCISPNTRFLFEGYENIPHTPRIDEMLMACASVQVIFGDGLPSNICHVCVEQLRNAFVFKHQCEKIDASLTPKTPIDHFIVDWVFRLCTRERVQVKIKEELRNSDVIDSPSTLNNLLHKQSTKDKIEEDPLAPVAPKIETNSTHFMDNNQMLMPCLKCEKVFTTLEEQQCHKSVCTDKMYKCKQCNKKYITLNNFQRHKQSHGRRKKYVCQICNKILTRLDHVKKHMIIHLKEKPFLCKTCNRGFNQFEHLNKHTSKCTGIAGYPCDFCSKIFNREDSLEVHKKLHDNEQPKLQTIENLDNIEDHYYQIDQNGDVIFSDHSDADFDNNCSKPEVTESIDTDKIKEEADISYQNDEKVVSEEVAAANSNNDIDSSLHEDKNESIENRDIAESMKKEEAIMEIEIEDNELDFHQFENDNILDLDDDNSGGDSTCSGHLLKKALVSEKVEGGRRSTPQKNSSNSSKSLKMKKYGRTKIHPQKNIKKEDEQYGKFPCPVCQEIFKTMSQLDKHKRHNHKGIKIHKCPICNKEFNKAIELKRHVTAHSNVKLFQCTICRKSFNRREQLNRHQKVHEAQNDVKCDICQKPFNKVHHLATHKALKHGTGKKVIDGKQFKCPLCQKCFKTEKYRDIHVTDHSEQKEYRCTKCEKTLLSKSRLNEHMRFHNQHSKKFLCSECGHRFSRNDYLVIHMRRHTGEKPFKCKYCDKGFPRTTDVRVHERYHTGEKTHLCTVCGRGFTRACYLTVHMRTHTGEKPYQCTYCIAAYAQSSDLKAHVRRHTGERFHCELCTESFILGYLLTQHKRNVHGITKLKPPQTFQRQENREDSPIATSEQKPVIP